MTRMLPTIGSILAAFALVAILVAPAFAGEGGTSLRDGSFSPGSGSTSTRFAFSVSYQDDAGRPPFEVDVTVGGDQHRMHWSGGHDWRHGVRFDWSGTLPAGTQAVTFGARTQHHDQIRASAGSISVSAPATPAPTPTPTAHPTPHPTPHPTARPTSKPAIDPTAHPTAPPTTRPHDHPTATPSPSPSPSPSPTTQPTGSAGDGIGGSAAVTPTGDSTFDPSAEPSDETLASDMPTASDDSVAVAGPLDSADGQGDTTSPLDQRPVTGRPLHGGPLAAILTTIGVADPELPVLPLIPTVVGTSGAAASMALGLFGRRRRTDEQPAPDAVLAAAAADGIGVGDGAAQGLSLEADSDDELDADLEALLPRWRRPSLLQARRADPLRTDAVTPRLTFDHGIAGSLGGLERRIVRYTVVRLLDAPDELRGREIGAVGEGDEVGLLEKHGSYWLVQCPNGGKGWLHQMTLGAIEDGGVSADAAATPNGAESASQDGSEAAADSEIDDDVLAAYLASRRRAG